MNLTEGGLFGYCSSKCITRRKVPSSKGVSAGPMMIAFLFGDPGVSREDAEDAEDAVGEGAGRRFSPGHDVVGHRGRGHASGRVGLHALLGRSVSITRGSEA